MALSNSYGGSGNMKKSRMERVELTSSCPSNNNKDELHDPTNDWVKKSWNKKKEKKISIDDFEQIKELGTGKYGHVFLAR